MTKKYTWEFSDKAWKLFKKMDTSTQKRIIKWLDEHIYMCENPRQWGKALTGNLGEFWRYRVGKYRIVAKIIDDVFIVEVINVDKRADIYK